MNKVLITGGAGYIGSHLVEQLVHEGCTVTVLDNLVRGYRPFLPTSVHFVKGDVRDIPESLKGPFDVVYHLAGLTYVHESYEQEDLYHDVNFRGTKSLLRWMVANRCVSLVFASSCSVYGNGPDYLETDLPAPISPYAYSKALAECAIEAAAFDKNIKADILRFANIAGASESGILGERNSSRIISNIFNAALGRKTDLTIYGQDFPTLDGTAIRDYLHVLDLCRGLSMAGRQISLEYFGHCTTINFGSGVGTSILELVYHIEKITGRNIPIRTGPRKPGDPEKVVYNPSRAYTELGWEPIYSLQDIIASAHQWHRRH